MSDALKSPQSNFAPLSTSARTSWQRTLIRFEEVVYPQVFEKRGISKETAMILWWMADVKSEIEQLCALVADTNALLESCDTEEDSDDV